MRQRRTRKDMVLLIGLGIFLISPSELRFAPPQERAVAAEQRPESTAVAPSIDLARTARND